MIFGRSKKTTDVGAMAPGGREDSRGRHVRAGCEGGRKSGGHVGQKAGGHHGHKGGGHPGHGGGGHHGHRTKHGSKEAWSRSGEGASRWTLENPEAVAQGALDMDGQANPVKEDRSATVATPGVCPWPEGCLGKACTYEGPCPKESRGR